MNSLGSTGREFWLDFSKWALKPLLYVDLFKWLFVEIPGEIPYYFQWSKEYATKEESMTYRFFKYCLLYHVVIAAMYIVGLILGFWASRFLNIWPLMVIIVISQAVKFFFNIMEADAAGVANAFGWPASKRWGFAPLINAFFLSSIIQTVRLGSFEGFFQNILK